MNHHRSVFRRIAHSLLAAAGAALCSPGLAQSTIVLPALAEQGNSTNTVTQSTERTMQCVYDATLLAALPLGAQITGMAYRMNTGQPTSPAGSLTWTNYDVQLATSVLRPGYLSNTLATNVGADAVMVRSGSLTIDANSLPGGTGPNPFGPVIPFTTPFPFSGGHLLLTVRHTGNGAEAPILDAAADYPGYVQCRINTGAGAYSATTSTGNGTTAVVQFTWQPASGPQEIMLFNGPNAGHPQLNDGQTTPLRFGAVPAGLSGKTRTFTIGNAGSLPLNAVSVSVDGANAADFTVTQPAGTLAAGARMTFQVTFHPSGAGTRSAMLRVLSNDASESSFDVPLSGIGSLALNSTFREADVVVGRPDFVSLTGFPSAANLTGPVGVAVSVDGKMAVADQIGRRVLIWNSIPTSTGQPANVVVGKTNFTTVTAGTTQSLISTCNGVTFSPDGQKLIVADSGNARVLIWNTVPATSGAPADVVIGQTDFVTSGGGLSASKFASLAGVLVTPDGRLLVSDLGNDRVLIFNSIPTTNGAAADVVIGQPDMMSTSPGNTADKMDAPWDLALTPDGRLLVADQANNRVLVFNTVPTVNGASADVVIGHADFGASTQGTSATQLDFPTGVAVSASGQLVIAEADNDCVAIFSSVPTSNGAAADYVLGQPNLTTGLSYNGGMSAASMNEPWAVAFAPDGRLMVAGREMGRVMVFAPAVATLSAPVAGTLTKSPVSIAFTLQEHTLPGTAQLIFHDGTTPRALTLASSQESAGAHSFSFDPANPTASAAIAAGLPIPDGLHTVTLAYQDFSGGTIFSPAAASVRIDTTAPSFSLPANIVVEAVAAAGNTVNYSASASDSGSGVASSSFLPASGSVFPLGTTTVDANATDVAGNAAMASFTVTVQDTTAPVVTPPSNVTVEATSAAGVVVNYADATASDAVGAASVMVSQASGSVFPLGVTTVTVTAKDAANNTGTATFTVTVQDTTPPVVTPPSNVTVEATSAAGTTVNYPDATASDAVGVASVMHSQASGTVFPLGVTTVTVMAKDAANNAGTATFTVTVQDTIDPTIGGAFAPLIFVEGMPLPDYRGQAQTSDATTVTVTQEPPPGAATSAGKLTVKLTASDLGTNTADVSFDIAVRATGATHDVAWKSGDPAPGAGAAGGPPADALLASFGVPAIDAAGNVAFTAKWMSAASGKGAGLFLNDRCLAIVGGDASAIAGAGARWKSFAEPVIDGGRVVCLATLSGVPKPTASAIVGSAGTALEKIARAGEVATEDGAKFAAFKAVAVAGDGVAFLAQLAAGTGTPRTSAAIDIGLWVKDGAGAPVLVLRDGDGNGTLPITKLIAFKAGAGSAGQGRGWLRLAAGVPEVLALTMASDRSQVLFSANATSRTVLGRTAGEITSFGLPAINAAGATAFLESHPASGRIVRSVRSQGISIAVGEEAGATGATFAAFRDPVLAADNAFAFPATIAGGAVRGLAKTTLWWYPPGDSLRLLAQGGEEPAELPGAQWKSFPSLAIAANRGPVFTGTLVPGKGAVTKATANGVWACDFTGALRLLVRTGDTSLVAGRTLRSFTLLTATRGSEGVTRSFNDNAQVVWRATFDDKSQAIVTTEVP